MLVFRPLWSQTRALGLGSSIEVIQYMYIQCILWHLMLLETLTPGKNHLLYISVFFIGFDTDTEGDEDIHLCKKCKLVFTNLSDYLQHKVKHDNYKVKLSRTSDRRMLFPQLIQKPEKSEKGSEKENIQRRRRGL